MSDLLDNMLCVQGIDTRNAGHTGSQLGAFTPPGAKQSAAALSADASNAPFAAVNLGAPGFTFRTIANKSAISTSPTGGITALLRPFRPVTATKYLSDKDVFKAALSGFLKELDAVAKSGHQGAQTIIENRESSLKLAETNFGDLDAQWAVLVAKYNDLITRSLYCESGYLLPGLNDKPVGEGGTGEAKLYELDYMAPVGLNTLPDFRSIVAPTATLRGLAESFALTEYILLNKLSSSISLNIPDIDGLHNPLTNMSMRMFNDSHTAGLYPHTLISILRHRAGAACILELITRLKAANLFDNTVIREAGEFNRVPVDDLSGSNHGQIGLSHTFYCGEFNGPIVVGNLALGNGKNHWGAGGIIPQLGRNLYLTDAIATLAYLLKVPAPLTSAGSVVALTGSGLSSLIGTTEYV